MSEPAGTVAGLTTEAHSSLTPRIAAVPAGAQIPLEDVPSVQKEVVMRCRQMGRPVIVASHLLQSMIEYPTPTRAEVGGAGIRLHRWRSASSPQHVCRLNLSSGA